MDKGSSVETSAGGGVEALIEGVGLELETLTVPTASAETGAGVGADAGETGEGDVAASVVPALGAAGVGARGGRGMAPLACGKILPSNRLIRKPTLHTITAET